METSNHNKKYTTKLVWAWFVVLLCWAEAFRCNCKNYSDHYNTHSPVSTTSSCDVFNFNHLVGFQVFWMRRNESDVYPIVYASWNCSCQGGRPDRVGEDRLIENRQRWKWCLASSHSWFFFTLKGFPHPHHEFLSFPHLMKTSWMGTLFFFLR